MRFNYFVATLLAVVTSLFWLDQGFTAGKSRYTNDQCPPLRRGSDETYKIVKFLGAGLPVEVLQNGENGWQFVRVAGAEGWVMGRSLTDTPPPLAQLELEQAARKKADELNAQLHSEIQILRERLTNHNAMASELEHIKQVSANAIAMDQELIVLKESLKQTQATLEQVTEEKNSFELRSDINFFLAGAGVLILGFIGGSALSGKRRRNDSL